MKKMKFIVGVAAAALAVFAIAGCDLELGDDDRISTQEPPAPAFYNALSSEDGVKIIGNGSFVNDDTFGTVYQNVADAAAYRTNALEILTDGISEISFSSGITIGFWVNKGSSTPGQYMPTMTLKQILKTTCCLNSVRSLILRLTINFYLQIQKMLITVFGIGLMMVNGIITLFRLPLRKLQYILTVCRLLLKKRIFQHF